VYLVSRFPSLRNTFVVRELDGLSAAGIQIHLISLLRPETGLRHARTDRWLPMLAARPGLARCMGDLIWWFAQRPMRVFVVAMSIVKTNVARLHRPRAGLAALLVGAAHARRLRAEPWTHLHAHFEIATNTAWVMHKLAGFSYSFTVHTDEAISAPPLARDAESANLVVTPSHHTAAGLRKRLGPNAPIAVIRAAIPVAEYPFRPRQIPAVGRVRAVCVAGLEAYKGHAILLKALAGDPALVRIALDIVGDGSLRRSLERLTEQLYLGDRVRFRGPMTEDQVLRLLAETDLFVLASVIGERGQCDNVPVALMEAMASGVPVVASRLAGIPELVADGVTGSLAEPGSVDDLSRALREILASGSELLRITQRARDRVEQEFDLAANATQLAALLRRASRAVEAEGA